MEVSIFCSALYTPGTSQMVEYTLNELTDMHFLYGDIYIYVGAKGDWDF